MEILHRIHLFLGGCKGSVYAFLRYYGYKMTIPYKAYRIRQKPKIKVLFVVSEISMWKTERLYQLMCSHNRFDPILVYVPDCVNSNNKSTVENYFRSMGYSYEELNQDDTIKSKIRPDIIFYQQAYPGYVADKYFEYGNRYALFCHVNYCFRNTITKSTVDLPLLNIAWKVFSENEVCSKELASLMRNKGKNLENTGLPFMDDFCHDVNFYPDRWQTQDVQKKRIIYAPHHSILDEDKLAWGSVLEYGDFVLSMARKYSKETQWVFKPHPFLKAKLIKVWGKERAEKYYSEWASLPNTQMVDGDYIDIFKHSDAMLHDCGSFMIEYMYTQNPVMYIFSSRPQKGIPISALSQESLNVHYHGHNHEEIETFINDVINGRDSIKQLREEFYNRWLKPKGDCSENIIKSILG